MDIEQAREYLKELYPEYNITSGYIGNFGRYGDGRSWRIWINDIDVKDIWGNYPLYIRLGSTAQVIDYTQKEWIMLLMRAVRRIERAINSMDSKLEVRIKENEVG